MDEENRLCRPRIRWDKGYEDDDVIIAYHHPKYPIELSSLYIGVQSLDT